MCHIAIEYVRAALHWIVWGYDRSMDVIVLFPPGNASLGDVKQLTDVFRCIPMQCEPEDTLIQVFVDVAINHDGVEFAGEINQQHKTKQHAHNNSAWSLLDSARKKLFTGLFFFSKWCMTRFLESAVSVMPPSCLWYCMARTLMCPASVCASMYEVCVGILY